MNRQDPHTNGDSTTPPILRLPSSNGMAAPSSRTGAPDIDDNNTLGKRSRSDSFDGSSSGVSERSFASRSDDRLSINGEGPGMSGCPNDSVPNHGAADGGDSTARCAFETGAARDDAIPHPVELDTAKRKQLPLQSSGLEDAPAPPVDAPPALPAAPTRRAPAVINLQALLRGVACASSVAPSPTTNSTVSPGEDVGANSSQLKFSFAEPPKKKRPRPDTDADRPSSASTLSSASRSDTDSSSPSCASTAAEETSSAPRIAPVELAAGSVGKEPASAAAAVSAVAAPRKSAPKDVDYRFSDSFFKLEVDIPYSWSKYKDLLLESKRAHKKRTAALDTVRSQINDVISAAEEAAAAAVSAGEDASVMTDKAQHWRATLASIDAAVASGTCAELIILA